METGGARAWYTETSVDIEAVFPSSHRVHREWAFSTLRSLEPSESAFRSKVGVIDAALSLLRAGRMGSLVDTIRADTEGELLDQADALLKGYPIAATVIAGGALETHLRYLVTKNALSISGAGSIDKYEGAIAQARNAGNEIYSATLSKQVKAWGGLRNDAAHRPGEFKATEEDVRRMIDGVRDFIDRTT